MINKYWDLADVNLVSQETVAAGDLVCYGVPKPKPTDPVVC